MTYLHRDHRYRLHRSCFCNIIYVWCSTLGLCSHTLGRWESHGKLCLSLLATSVYLADHT